VKEKFVKNGEVEIQYIAVNYSPAETPVIIIPGAIVGAEDMYNDIKDYIDFYCIIISIRGRGKSSSPDKGYSKEEQVSDIEAVIKEECLDNFYLLGHSFGASLAYYYSIKHPEKIKGLIAVDFPTIYPGYSQEWVQYVRNNVSDVSENLLNGMVKDGVYEDFADELAKLDFKKLFIKGSGGDSLLKLETANKILEKLSNSSLNIISGSGHEIFYEKPFEILKEIREFIS